MSVDRGGSDRHPVTAHRLPPRLANSPGQVGRGAGRHPPRRIHPRPGVQVRGVCRRGLQPDAHPGMRRRAGRPSRRRSQPSGPAIRPPPVAAIAFRTVRVGRRPRGRAALCGAWGAAALRGADGSKNTPCILSGPGAEKLQPQPVSADGEGGTIGGRNRSPPRVAGPGGRGEALRLARNAVHLLDERFGSTPRVDRSYVYTNLALAYNGAARPREGLPHARAARAMSAALVARAQVHLDRGE